MDNFDFLIVFGLGLVVTGMAMWSLPAAFVVAGIGFVGFGLAGARRKAMANKEPAD